MSKELQMGDSGLDEIQYQWKKGSRVLGVGESFEKEDTKSLVSGVIMRGDMRIDGFGFCQPDVGGNNATEELLRMFRDIARDDIRAWLIGGSVISWFNIVDINLLHKVTRIPVACVSYEESEGIEDYIHEYFPDDYHKRIELLNKNGDRVKVRLEHGFDVYVLTAGMSERSAKNLLNLFTLDGRIPEPIRVARSLSSSIRASIL